MTASKKRRMGATHQTNHKRWVAPILRLLRRTAAELREILAIFLVLAAVSISTGAVGQVSIELPKKPARPNLAIESAASEGRVESVTYDIFGRSLTVARKKNCSDYSFLIQGTSGQKEINAQEFEKNTDEKKIELNNASVVTVWSYPKCLDLPKSINTPNIANIPLKIQFFNVSDVKAEVCPSKGSVVSLCNFIYQDMDDNNITIPRDVDDTNLRMRGNIYIAPNSEGISSIGLPIFFVCGGVGWQCFDSSIDFVGPGFFVYPNVSIIFDVSRIPVEQGQLNRINSIKNWINIHNAVVSVVKKSVK